MLRQRAPPLPSKWHLPRERELRNRRNNLPKSPALRQTSLFRRMPNRGMTARVGTLGGTLASSKIRFKPLSTNLADASTKMFLCGTFILYLKRALVNHGYTPECSYAQLRALSLLVSRFLDRPAPRPRLSERPVLELWPVNEPFPSLPFPFSPFFPLPFSHSLPLPSLPFAFLDNLQAANTTECSWGPTNSRTYGSDWAL